MILSIAPFQVVPVNDVAAPVPPYYAGVVDNVPGRV
jgi:hypothetical protein